MIDVEVVEGLYSQMVLREDLFLLRSYDFFPSELLEDKRHFICRVLGGFYHFYN